MVYKVNVVSSFFSCYVSAGSLSRSVLVGSLNVYSQVSPSPSLHVNLAQFYALVTVAVIVLVLLVLTQLFL